MAAEGEENRRYPARPVVGVGAVILDRGRVLLARRARPPRRGEWSLPGGAQHSGETVEAALRREVREETGLELGPLTLLGVVDAILKDGDGRVRHHYTIIDFAAQPAAGEARAGDDAADLRWASAEEAERLVAWDETRRMIRLGFLRPG